MPDVKSSGKGRTRNFATVVYPESAPDGWQNVLSDQFVPAFISPIHEDDLNPTGEKKKPHYHVMIMYDSVKTVDQARELFTLIGGVGCEIVQSVRGYARYLCHLDNPEKAQYSPDDVRCLCGADYTNVIGLVTDKYKAIREMIDFCITNNVYSYAILLEYCSIHRGDWFRVLCDNGTVVIKEYLKSRSWTDAQLQASPVTAPATTDLFCEKCGTIVSDADMVCYQDGHGICRSCANSNNQSPT